MLNANSTKQPKDDDWIQYEFQANTKWVRKLADRNVQDCMLLLNWIGRKEKYLKLNEKGSVGKLSFLVSVLSNYTMRSSSVCEFLNNLWLFVPKLKHEGTTFRLNLPNIVMCVKFDLKSHSSRWFHSFSCRNRTERCGKVEISSPVCYQIEIQRLRNTAGQRVWNFVAKVTSKRRIHAKILKNRVLWSVS